jgi:hypothetical protein
MPTRKELLDAAARLHEHLLGHFDRGRLHGPDPGVRFNLRVWRFLKSFLGFIPWKDDYVFMQAQGYWVLANWMLHGATDERRYREIAIETTEATLKLQTAEGFWAYPLPERRHLIAALESVWGGTVLLASYGREARREFLSGAIRAYDFLVDRLGFQNHTRGKAINYFDQPRGKVPNNSVAALWYFIRLHKATGDHRYLEHVDGLLDFLATVQLSSGELPYVVGSPYEKARAHYLCYQYNAFQFLQVAWAAALQPDQRARSILTQLARFLEKGVRPTGACAVDCIEIRGVPEVDYYTAALGAALWEAARLGLVESTEPSEQCYARVLARQRPDGSFGFSMGDYGLLRDSRSYPRAQAMTLFHLLYPYCGNGFSRAADS